MHDSGSIATFETDEDAKLAGYKTPLSEVEAKTLLLMNRHERRAQLARMRHKEKHSKREVKP